MKLMIIQAHGCASSVLFSGRCLVLSNKYKYMCMHMHMCMLHVYMVWTHRTDLTYGKCADFKCPSTDE